jgi:hypothetical protein
MISSAGAFWLALCAAQAASATPPSANHAAPPAAREDAPSTTRAAAYDAIPLPVRFGTLSLGQLGQYVDYELRAKGAKTSRVRVAYVTDKVDQGSRLRQVEFDFADLNPRVLVVLWLLLEPAPMVARMAIWVPPAAPLSVPVNARLDSLEGRGVARQTGAAPVASGSFAGPARQVVYTTSAGATAQAVLSDRVPLLGVASVELGEQRWVALASGEGARSLLFAVPLKVPNLPQLP